MQPSLLHVFRSSFLWQFYYACRRTFKHVEGEKKTTATQSVQKETEVEISKEETKARIQALVLVFAVVIFFWMAFHQNGLTLTLFAKEFTTKNVTGIQGMVFNVWNLVACVFIVYSLFGLFQSKTSKGKLISAFSLSSCCSILGIRILQSW